MNLFYEASTRTRTSFELAAKRLSADVVNFAPAARRVEKGESLKDTVQTLAAYWPDAIVIRTPHAGAAAARRAAGPTPRSSTPATASTSTRRRRCSTSTRCAQRLGALDGARIWIVGDVLHSRVARSNILAFSAMGAQVTRLSARRR